MRGKKKEFQTNLTPIPCRNATHDPFAMHPSMIIHAKKKQPLQFSYAIRPRRPRAVVPFVRVITANARMKTPILCLRNKKENSRVDDVVLVGLADAQHLRRAQLQGERSRGCRRMHRS